MKYASRWCIVAYAYQTQGQSQVPYGTYILQTAQTALIASRLRSSLMGWNFAYHNCIPYSLIARASTKPEYLWYIDEKSPHFNEAWQGCTLLWVTPLLAASKQLDN